MTNWVLPEKSIIIAALLHDTCKANIYKKTQKYHIPLHWFELAREPWTYAYRSTGTPCSCILCRGMKYDRLGFKRETQRIINECLD